MWDVWFLGQIVYSTIEHPSLINKKILSIFSGPESGQHLRLTGGNEIHAGFLEIKLYSGAPWTKVCKDSYWNSNTATVACRELGYDLGSEGSHSKEVDSNSFDLEPLKLNCEGNEKTLQQCKSIRDSHQCSKSGQALFLGEFIKTTFRANYVGDR